MSHHSTDSESAILFPPGRGDESASGNVLVSAVQPDLFVVFEAIHDWLAKDDVPSTEYPISSLSKNCDTRICVYSRAGRSIRVIPSVVGVTIVFDKDILIYYINQIVRGHDAGIKASRRVRVDVYPFLLGTRRSIGSATHERVVDMCRRLKGTTIETNVRTNKEEQPEGSGLTEDYHVTTWTKGGEGALELELTISKWLYRAAMDFDIPTLHLDYFSLSQALERRLYELTRKHCGDKAWWEISLPLLLKKAGSSQTSRRLKQEVKEIVKRNPLPDYQMFLDGSVKSNKLVIMTCDDAKLVCEANKASKLSWVSYLLQKKLA